MKAEEAVELRTHMETVDVARALEVEAEIRHNLMAELKVFAEQAALGGRILHLGATSMDIEDNAEVLRVRQSLELLLAKLKQLLCLFAEKIEAGADLPLMAYTHLQPAEPTTLSYRLAQYAHDLLQDWETLQQMQAGLRGKGCTGEIQSVSTFLVATALRFTRQLTW